MKKGLLVHIYRSDYDCKLNALYGKKSAVLTGEGIAEIFEPSEECPEIKVGKILDHYYCEPVKASPEGHTSYMCGGTFVATSDSRFPFDGALSLHDRTETWEMYKQLSI